MAAGRRLRKSSRALRSPWVAAMALLAPALLSRCASGRRSLGRSSPLRALLTLRALQPCKQGRPAAFLPQGPDRPRSRRALPLVGGPPDGGAPPRRALLAGLAVPWTPQARALTLADVAPEQRWLALPAREVVAQSEEALAQALQDWRTLASGGGDAVRRALGTVGTVSPVYALRRAMKRLAKEDPELIEQTQKVEERLIQADFLAYSSNFVETSGDGCPAEGPTNGGSCQARYLSDTRAEVEALLAAVGDLKRMLPAQ